MMKTLKLILLALLLVIPVQAQNDFPVPFTWDTAGITFLYPANWDTPLAVNDGGPSALQLAQSLVELPELRPPAVPVITFTLFSGVDSSNADFTEWLQASLTELDVQPDDSPTSINFIGANGQQMRGATADGQYSGLSRAAVLADGSVLVLAGRTLAVQQAEFETIFELVANSTSTNASDVGAILPTETDDEETAVSTYGVVWNTQRSFEDGEAAFLELSGLVYASGDLLYSYDYSLGLVQFDAVSGRVLGVYPNENIVDPVSMAVDSSGTVYVTDLDCSCIYMFGSERAWRTDTLSGFGENAPYYVAATPDGRVFATNENDEGVITVRVFQSGTFQQEIPLSEDMFLQPLLATDPAGRVLALTEFGDILALESGSATPLYVIDVLSETVTGMVVTAEGNFAIADLDQGIVIVDNQGTLIDQPVQLVSEIPQPGQVVSPTGIAIGPDGTLYYADSDGRFGAVTAISTSVPQGRIGTVALTYDLSVQGDLNEAVPAQSWTFEGTAGQMVTINATDASFSDAFDLRLRLLAPDGSEEALSEDQPGEDLYSPNDPQIKNHTLAASGTYTIAIEAVDGQGVYKLVITPARIITLDTAGAAALDGQLDDVLVSQQWILEGQAGQTLDITLQSVDGSTDTVLRVLGPQGDVLAENDDADNTDLGTDSQLMGVTLPENGTYIIEAARFDGSGPYQLRISPTTQSE